MHSVLQLLAFRSRSARPNLVASLCTPIRAAARHPAWTHLIAGSGRIPYRLAVLVVVLVLGVATPARADLSLYGSGRSAIIQNPLDLGKCMDADGSAPQPGEAVFLFVCHGSENQQFRRGTDGMIRVRVNGQQWCVTAGVGPIPAGYPAWWQPLGTAVCTGAPNQLWEPLANNGVRMVGTTTCIDLGYGNTSNNAPIGGGADCYDGVNQRWFAVDPGLPTGGMIDVVEFHAGPNVEKSLCPEFGILPDVATRCGALVVTHVLPAVTTYGKAYAPTLAYVADNSWFQQLTVDVTLPAGAPRPDALTLAVYAVAPDGVSPGALVFSKQYAGTGITPGTAQRLNTGVFSSPGNVVNQYIVSVTQSIGATVSAVGTSQRGQVAHAQRLNNAEGNLWHLLGVEEITGGQPDNSIIWVGGDGSTRKYTYVQTRGDTGVYAAPSILRPDTLLRNAVTLEYRRVLPHRASVLFNNIGQQTTVIDRHGRETHYTYDTHYGWGTEKGRISTITVPGPTTADLTYTFTYYPESTVVVAPGNRRTRIDRMQINSGGSMIYTTGVKRITDPDGSSVSFEYEPWDQDQTLLARTDRRGTRTEFVWQPWSLDIAAASTPDGAGQVVTHGFTTPRGLSAAPGAAPVPTASVLYTYDGPRTDVADVTTIAVDTLGAPVRVVDAEGKVTTVVRGDMRYQGLVTAVTVPAAPFDGITPFVPASNMSAMGAGTSSPGFQPTPPQPVPLPTPPTPFTMTATYDAQGHLATSTALNPYGDGRNPTTTYQWDAAWDDVQMSTAPEHEFSESHDDPLTGLTDWTRVGGADSTRTSYRYNPDETLRAVQYPVVAGETVIDSLLYDVLGNLRQRMTFQKSGAADLVLASEHQFLRDELGRPIRTQTRVFTADRSHLETDTLGYDVADRVLVSKHYGVDLNRSTTPPFALQVRHSFDAAGADTLVERWSIPDVTGVGLIATRYRRDALGRVVQTLSPDSTANTWADNPVDTTWYGPSGLIDSTRTRRGLKVRMTYDVLGRLSTKTSDGVTYQANNWGVSGQPAAGSPLGRPFPFLTEATSLPGVDETFTYDVSGSIADANNTDAKVHRDYYPNGQLRQETLRIRTIAALSAAGTFDSHVYSTQLSYDADGRLTTLVHPSQLAARIQGSDGTARYAYDNPLVSTPSSMQDLSGATISFDYNANGALARIERPGGVIESLDYTGAGALARQRLVQNGSSLRDAAFQYDARGKLLTLTESVLHDLYQQEYSDFGQLTSTTHQRTMSDPVGGYVETQSLYWDALDLPYRSPGSSRAYTGNLAGRPSETYSIALPNRIESGTGRMLEQHSFGHTDVYVYDRAGNVELMGQPHYDDHSIIQSTTRASYYDATERLRYSDYRTGRDDWQVKAYQQAFEAYRYDALGRRVLVRSIGHCYGQSQAVSDQGYVVDMTDACEQSIVRRTVWSGSQELWEIQVPGEEGAAAAQLENDTTPITTGYGNSPTSPLDRYTYFGLVAYDFAGAIDKPIAVTRSNWVDAPVNEPQLQAMATRAWTFYPHYNHTGQPFLAHFATGSLTACEVEGDLKQHCFTPSNNFPAFFAPWAQSSFLENAFTGTLLADKRDKTQTLYRRNRTYDPATGLFTQEDPLGLAGGINVYGYANGDPVNYADPFGLTPIDDALLAMRIWAAVAVLASTNPNLDKKIGEAASEATKALAEGDEYLTGQKKLVSKGIKIVTEREAKDLVWTGAKRESGKVLGKAAGKVAGGVIGLIGEAIAWDALNEREDQWAAAQRARMKKH